jgi:hypothetical protein
MRRFSMREIRSAPSNCPENLVHLCTGEDKPQGDRKMAVFNSGDNTGDNTPDVPKVVAENPLLKDTQENSAATDRIAGSKIEGSVSQAPNRTPEEAYMQILARLNVIKDIPEYKDTVEQFKKMLT